jgi:hypothetical protein
MLDPENALHLYVYFLHFPSTFLAALLDVQANALTALVEDPPV